MAVQNYPSGFRGGALIKNVPMFDAIDGNVFWVDSGTGAAGAPGTFNSPFDTIENAMGSCTASNGDVIFCKSGHTEAAGAAAAITCDVIGVTIVGLGHGATRAQIRFTAAASDVDITAEGVRFFNIRFTAAFADVVSGLDISGANTEFHDCVFDEEQTDENWKTSVINVADGTGGLVVDGCTFHGNDGENDACIVFAGSHLDCIVSNNRFFYETAQASVVAFITSATKMENFRLEYNYFHSETAVIAAGFVVLQNATNNGWAIGNQLSCIDADATAANAVSAFDLGGLHCSGNFFTAGVDNGYGIESFLTIDDLT